MKHLMCLSFFMLVVTLSGCGKESDQLPVDGRDFDGVEYSNQGPYKGKVIDGYLRNARVWLDMDGDSQYTPGPLTLTLANGNTVILSSGEPTAMSGPGGAFSLDTAELEIQPEVGPDLKATDFPLYALAIPGKTLEETRNGDVTISKGYLMSAAPGVRNITPLTTLARYRALALLFPGSGPDPTASYNGINLVQDYILANDEQGHAYARALARFMASQFPEAYNDVLKAPGSDGTERYLSKPAAYLLGVSAVQNAGDVFAVVDSQAGAGGYANIDIDALDLPQIPLDLDDPVLLISQRIHAESERSGTLPANNSDLIISAELTFNYREDGRLESVSADGCLAPSMPELARLIRADGYMVRLDTQWLPAAALSHQSAVNHGDNNADERLVFNWDEQRIEFETTTTCHDHEGIEAGSSELGGNPEVVYSWTGNNRSLTELAATIPATGATRTLTLETANATEGFPGYRYSENATEKASLTFSAGVTSCTIEDDAKGAGLVVSASQNYSFTGYDPQPVSFVDLALEFDNREFSYPEGTDDKLTVHRLLRYGFLDPSKSSLTEVDADRGFEWIMSYPQLDNAGFVPGQPNLISEAYLNKYAGGRNCGREFNNQTSAHYARVEYRYQRLSEYLTGLLQ